MAQTTITLRVDMDRARRDLRIEALTNDDVARWIESDLARTPYGHVISRVRVAEDASR